MARRPLASTSVRDALDSALIPLRAAGLDTPRLDAEVLLAHALGTDRAGLILHPEQQLGGEQARWFQDAVLRRRKREPVAYIVGTKGFRRLDLDVDRRVLIPRPETEHVVEAALTLPPGTRVVDVGTGSGAIALAVKDERPDLEVLATDVSEDALAVARANAARLKLAVTFVHGDLLAGVEAEAVVSNPPYVDPSDPVMPEVGYEPAGAVYGNVYERLIAQAGAARFIALEHGEGQADAVTALLARAGFTTERIRDLAGIERVAVGRRR
jgi:release factor glutamine methyltransferase